MRFSRALFVLAGVAVGTLTELLRPSDSRDLRELRRSFEGLENRLGDHDARLAQVESRVDSHEARLQEVPTTAQIVGAMEDLLGKTMAGLDNRLSAQAHSIEILKTTVAETDQLLERVLESLDSLRERVGEEQGAPPKPEGPRP